jgi:hypothetical protein
VASKLRESGRQLPTANERDGQGEGDGGGQRPSLLQLVHSLLFKLKYFETETYAGAPAVATPERGEAILEELSRQAAEALEELLAGTLHPRDCHSPLWPARHLITNETLAWLLERALRYRDRVF